MMKWLVHAKNAGRTNSPKARIRECRRMLMLGKCLEILGEDVTWSGSAFTTEQLMMEPLPQYKGDRDRIIIDSQFGGKSPVTFNTSFSTRKFLPRFDISKIVITHEYCPHLEDHPALMPIAFPVHDVIIQHFAQVGLLDAYLRDDLEPIQEYYAQDRTNKIGFIGNDNYGRGTHIKTLETIYPDMDVELFWDPARQNLPPRDYLNRLASWRAGMFISGDTPKANRWCELVILKTPIVCVPIQPRIEPVVSESNTIFLKSWDDKEGLERQLPLAQEKADQAIEDYLSGWSILAIARNLIKRCKELNL